MIERLSRSRASLAVVGSGIVGAGFLAGIDARVTLLLVALAVCAVGAWASLRNFPLVICVFLVARPAIDYFGLAVPAGGAFVGVTGTWIILRYRSGKLHSLSPWLIGYGGFIAAIGVSVFSSVDPLVSSISVLRCLATLLLMICVVELVAERVERIGLFLGAASLSFIVPAMLGMYQVISGNKFNADGRTGINSTFVHPNAFASYLAAIVGILALHFVRTRSAAVRTMLAFAIPVAAFLLIESGARGALLATGAAALIAFSRIRRGRVLAVFVLLSVAVLVAITPGVRERFSDLDNKNIYGSRGNANSLQWRIQYWQAIMRKLVQTPATGVGLDMTPIVMKSPFFPHNTYLQLAFEVGILGVVTFARTVVSIRRMIGRARASLNPGVPTLILASTYAGAVFLIQMLSENLLTSTVIHWYNFLPIGLLSGQLLADQRQREAAASSQIENPVVPDYNFSELEEVDPLAQWQERVWSDDEARSTVITALNPPDVRELQNDRS